MIRPPDWRFASTLAALTLVGPLAIHLFLPAMPAVKLAFGISDAASGLMLSVTLFVVAFATLAYGSLSDRYGRRPLLLGGLAIFTLGSAISALAPSPELLLAGRAVQAVGAGCSGGLTRAIARDAYGTEGLVTVIAYLTMAYTLGPMIAPLAGGFLIDASGWRSVFWLAAVSGAMILVAAWRVLGETLPAEKRLAQQAGMLRDYARLFSSLRFNAYVLQSGFSSATFFVMST
ncbi:MAG: MFS transporter, partial [Burkholderiales bacterium]|nr:MFS transporter [Burkholderiales bacterium]